MDVASNSCSAEDMNPNVESSAKEELEAVKLDIKTWEKGFFLEFDKKPTGSDIKSRPRIHSLYKRYADLKKEVEEVAQGKRPAASSRPTKTDSATLSAGSAHPTKPTAVSTLPPAQGASWRRPAARDFDEDSDEDDFITNGDSGFAKMFSSKPSAASQAVDPASALLPSSFQRVSLPSQSESEQILPAATIDDEEEAQEKPQPRVSLLEALFAQTLQTTTSNRNNDDDDEEEREEEEEEMRCGRLEAPSLPSSNRKEEKDNDSIASSSSSSCGPDDDDIHDLGLKFKRAKKLHETKRNNHAGNDNDNNNGDVAVDDDDDELDLSNSSMATATAAAAIALDEAGDFSDLFDTKRSHLKKRKERGDAAEAAALLPAPKRVKSLSSHQQPQQQQRRENFVKMSGKSKMGAGKTHHHRAGSNSGSVDAADEIAPYSNSISEYVEEENWDYEISDSLIADLKTATTKLLLPTFADELKIRNVLKHVWGFSEFRPGQLETIKRILCGRSTLLMVPTGGGKSLCYQLPSFLMASETSTTNVVTLVISPLISLMVDQLSKLPKGLNGVVMGSHQTLAEMKRSEEALRTPGAVQILFVSPERLVSKRFLRLIASSQVRIGFVCVDEAHCLSEWSHNFRPSYLTMCQIIRDVLGVQCILALTATATRKTSKSICSVLGIEDTEEAVIRSTPLRPNLRLHIQNLTFGSDDRFSPLVKILRQQNLKAPDCAIIYVNTQQRAEQTAYQLEQHGVAAQPYHAGMRPEQRRSVQEKFNRGLLRVVVATIAFGMGIDNSNVRCVIHLSLPRSIENYVQEIGRAGRDGQEAHCHLICSEDDALILRSFAHSDTQDRAQVKALILEIFDAKSKGGKSTKRSATKQHRSVLLPIDAIEEKLDMRRAVISTILAWLETKQYIKTLPTIHAVAELSFFGASLEKLRKKSVLMEAVAKIQRGSVSKKGIVTIMLQQLSEELNTPVSDVLFQLDQACGADADGGGGSGIKFTTRDPAFHLKILQHPDLDSVIDEIIEKMADIEKSALEKINTMWNLVADCTAAGEKEKEESHDDREARIANRIQDYFLKEPTGDDETSSSSSNGMDMEDKSSRLIRLDIKMLVASQDEAIKTPRQVARIFHGISSPQFPASVWSKNGLWAKRRHVDFNLIMKIARNVFVDSKILPRLPAAPPSSLPAPPPSSSTSSSADVATAVVEATAKCGAGSALASPTK